MNLDWDSDQSQPPGGKEFKMRIQPSLPELLTYNHPELRKYQGYTYIKLPENKKRIRLMKLNSGEPSGAKIYCELIQVEYDKTFHIPTKIQQNEVQDGERQTIISNKLDPLETEEEYLSRLEAACKEAEKKDVEIKKLEAENKKLEIEKKRWDTKKEKPETQAEKQKRFQRQEGREVVKRAKVQTEEAKVEEEEQKKKERFKQWEEVKKIEQKYEALSWCWGDAEEDYAILINEGHMTYKKGVRKELALALKYLRRADRVRYLWIDAVCIDQANPDERNHQVQMMSRIYTRASQVCIWLGSADNESEIAMDFIRNEMKELKNFDNISSNPQYVQKWKALMSLMQRDWFFRRWVVQEIALARAATVYCGSDSIPWKSFAVAVELFVEVETATHRLSEIMKKEKKSRYVPGWFEYVSELGASLLVQATRKVFRANANPMEQDNDSSDSEEQYLSDRKAAAEEKKKREEKEKKLVRQNIHETHTIDPLERRGLLSLEYLVSTMFIFQTSEPRDVVYALLAIARDAAPFAPSHYGQEDQKLFLVMTLLDSFLAEKPFVVDYNRPYSDVSRDFVEFAITRTHKTDPAQALDILCRPWAL